MVDQCSVALLTRLNVNVSKSLVGAALAAKGVLNLTVSFAAKAAPTEHIKFQTGCNTTLGYLTKEQLHPGLICLNSDAPMMPELQMNLFETALQFLHDNTITDLMNQVIEIDCIGDDVNIRHYEAPAP